jgi:Phosphate transporter family
LFVGPIVVRPVEAKRAIREAEAAKEVSLGGEGDRLPKDVVDEAVVAGQVFDVDGDDDDDQNKMETRPEDSTPPPTSVLGKMGTAFAAATYSQDLEGKATEESRTKHIWHGTETYDADTENLLTYLQVFKAWLNSFSHGANDVANTISPLSAIIEIYQTGIVDKSSDVKEWMLAFGGGVIVLY